MKSFLLKVEAIVKVREHLGWLADSNSQQRRFSRLIQTFTSQRTQLERNPRKGSESNNMYVKVVTVDGCMSSR